MKIAIQDIGTGNLGSSIAKGLINKQCDYNLISSPNETSKV